MNLSKDFLYKRKSFLLLDNPILNSMNRNNGSILLIIFIFIFSACSGVTDKHEKITKDEGVERLKEKAKEALEYCKANNMNTDYCILIDMKIHSGRNRMFVWSFKTNSVERAALCSHGVGRDKNKSTPQDPKFSNEDGSWLSSLGKYKLGIRSYSNWGINVHYKMHGLEKTNSNAFKRIIVLHSYEPVKDEEIYPEHLPLGWSQGCPVTSNEMMTFIDNKLQKTEQPTLLWIYY